MTSSGRVCTFSTSIHACGCMCVYKYNADSPFSPPNHNQNVVRFHNTPNFFTLACIARARLCWTIYYSFNDFLHIFMHILKHEPKYAHNAAGHNTNRHHPTPAHCRRTNKTMHIQLLFTRFPSPMAFQIFINSTLMEYNIRGSRARATNWHFIFK